MLPHLSDSPGGTDWTGPELGTHNRKVFCGELGLSVAELEALEGRGIV